MSEDENQLFMAETAYIKGFEDAIEYAQQVVYEAKDQDKLKDKINEAAAAIKEKKLEKVRVSLMLLK